ncbi:hypothetical protein DL93DRAFT_2072635 [Clavulina sp. PMI_390]|nr:hypothetical protein DL93DRAFT_2072635 [Clavulina sp. PMI_390]
MQAVAPVLQGLPLVGGAINVISGLASTIGGQKLGNLLAGKALTAAFVTGTNDTADTPNTVYQIDASTSASSPILLAQLPFALPTPACPGYNASNSSTPAPPLAVTMVLPILSNSSLQILCGTYNSTPSAPSMLIAHPCWNTTGTDGKLGAEPAGMSQVFAWDQTTGSVAPLYNGTAPLPAGTTCASPSGGPATPAPPTPASTIAEGDIAAPQSVTLVFSADPSIPNTTNATTAAPISPPISPPSSIPSTPANGTAPGSTLPTPTPRSPVNNSTALFGDGSNGGPSDNSTEPMDPSGEDDDDESDPSDSGDDVTSSLGYNNGQ